MRSRKLGWAVIGILTLLAAVPLLAETKKEFKYTVEPRANVSIRNEYGPVVVKAGTGRQVVIDAVLHSDKVEVDAAQTGNRVDVRTHFLQQVGANDGQVDYEITVPPDANVTVNAPGGPVQLEKLRGDVIIEGDGAHVDARDLSDGYVHVTTVDGPITLTNISNAAIDVMSVGGNVSMSNVTGRKVNVNTTTGNISYDGDFGSNGDYSLMNHSGNIDVVLPASASVDINARSLNGTAEDDFPLQQKTHASFAAVPGKSFSGTSKSGSSSVQLRSFSGTIRVKRR